jgi:biopolymer transport protein ExbD
MASTANRRRGIIAEINVTPLVDIMLVLLIIFMLTANLIARQAIEIDLPRATQATAAKPKALAISLTRDGSLVLHDHAVTSDELRAAVRAAVASDPTTQVIIAGDKAVSHGRVVWVLDLVKSLGVTSFAIQVDPGGLEAPRNL